MANKTPSHRIYQVESRGQNKKSFWREVGVAWENNDGSLNLDFQVIPMPGAGHTVQLRPFSEPKQQNDD